MHRPTVRAAVLAAIAIASLLPARALSAPGSSGSNETVRRAPLFQEASDAITYEWRKASAEGAFGGTFRTERMAGAKARLRFTGSKITWFTRLGPSQGKARMLIDGEVVRTVNNYAETTTWHKRRVIDGLGSGSHRLAIEVLGQPGDPDGGRWITVDGFRVGDQAELTPTTDAVFRWGRHQVQGALKGHVSLSDAEGARASFGFTGNGVDWVTRAGPNMGKARLLVDGEEHAVYDNYANEPRIRRIGIAGLARAAHTIEVVVLGSKRDASGGTRIAVDAFEVKKPSIVSFRRLGAWVDLYDYKLTNSPLDIDESIADMDANGVKTLYIQTARYNTEGDIAAPTRLGNWIDAAHDAGIRVVGWYLPAYDQFLDRDVRRTIAMARFESSTGEKMDAVSVDIEWKGAVESLEEFNEGIVRHLRRVRLELGNAYPIGAITPAPVGMARSPSSWEGFPWVRIGRYSDVVLPMAYWTYRDTCPEIEMHCPYGYARENIERSHNKTGLPVHIIGGSGDGFDDEDYAGPKRQVGDFVDGVLDEGALGGSFYDYSTMNTEHEGFWEHLVRLNEL